MIRLILSSSLDVESSHLNILEEGLKSRFILALLPEEGLLLTPGLVLTASSPKIGGGRGGKERAR